jgi:hypothetical protein
MNEIVLAYKRMNEDVTTQAYTLPGIAKEYASIQYPAREADNKLKIRMNN